MIITTIHPKFNVCIKQESNFLIMNDIINYWTDFNKNCLLLLNQVQEKNLDRSRISEILCLQCKSNAGLKGLLANR